MESQKLNLLKQQNIQSYKIIQEWSSRCDNATLLPFNKNKLQQTKKIFFLQIYTNMFKKKIYKI